MDSISLLYIFLKLFKEIVGNHLTNREYYSFSIIKIYIFQDFQVSQAMNKGSSLNLTLFWNQSYIQSWKFDVPHSSCIFNNILSSIQTDLVKENIIKRWEIVSSSVFHNTHIPVHRISIENIIPGKYLILYAQPYKSFQF